MDISFDFLNSLFNYDPSTGAVTTKGNDFIGSIDKKGYLRITISGSSIPAHRIAWILHYGSDPGSQIDHKNLKKSDNRILNLRLASNSQNAMNRKADRRNRSGVKGVYWHKDKRMWIAVVRKNGAFHFRKGFHDLEEARTAVVNARNEIHGEFARHE